MWVNQKSYGLSSRSCRITSRNQVKKKKSKQRRRHWLKSNKLNKISSVQTKEPVAPKKHYSAAQMTISVETFEIDEFRNCLYQITTPPWLRQTSTVIIHLTLSVLALFENEHCNNQRNSYWKQLSKYANYVAKPTWQYTDSEQPFFWRIHVSTTSIPCSRNQLGRISP
jgi:hypothetical protein